MCNFSPTAILSFFSRAVINTLCIRVNTHARIASKIEIHDILHTIRYTWNTLHVMLQVHTTCEATMFRLVLMNFANNHSIVEN